MTLSSFEDLDIWKEARELANIVRQLTRKTDFAKDFRFCSQINSAAGSIMDNISEGFERDGHKEFIQFLYIAKASNGECRSQAYRAFDTSFINKEELDDLLTRTLSIRNKIQGFIKYLKSSSFKGTKYKSV